MFIVKRPERAELLRFLKFGVTGVLNTVIDSVVYFALIAVFGFNIYAAQTLGYACGTLNSYIVNRSWTFSSKSHFFSAELVRFLVVNLITLGISYLVLYYLQLWFPGGNELLLKLPVVAVTLAVNFVLSRLWVFRAKDDSAN